MQQISCLWVVTVGEKKKFLKMQQIRLEWRVLVKERIIFPCSLKTS